MPCVLVLGASRGIGLALARQYRAAGWRVIATARDELGLARLKDLGCEPLRLDVAEPASVSRLSWSLDGEALDLVLYVAGVMDRSPADSPPTQPEFDRVMRTNVLGAMQVIPQILPMLQEARGTLACLSSVMGSLSQTSSGSACLYRVSKAALNMVVRCAQPDQADVTVLALHPGWVQTEMGGAGAPLTPEDSATRLRHTLEAVRLARRPEHRGAFLDLDGQPLPW